MQAHEHLFDEKVNKKRLNPKIGVECTMLGAGSKVGARVKRGAL